MNKLNKIFIKPKILLLIFLSVAILVISSAYYELNQSKKEMLHLMSTESHSLLEMVLVSSEEVLYASNEVEEEIQKRLLNNANAVKILLEKSKINNTILNRIARENEINRINILSRAGNRLYSSHLDRVHDDPSEDYIKKNLTPIFNDETDTLIIGLKKARADEGMRYVVAIASNENDAIVLNLDANELLDFRKRIGFGVLIKRLTENEDVIYAALESADGIIAASGLVDDLDIIEDTPFLKNSMTDSTFAWRITDFNGADIFEAVHPFVLMGEIVGLYRIGLSLEPLEQINQRTNRRIIIYGILLFLFGSIMLTLVFVRKNLDVVKKQYQNIETYSNKLTQSVSDAIIVTDHEQRINEINKAALNLFKLQYESTINTQVHDLLNNQGCGEVFSSIKRIKQIECEIDGDTKHLLISKSTFKDDQEKNVDVLIIKDLTEIKNLENQIARKEQMNAMGELASGVAHEIRNPLNSIATIVQQLDKDFEPIEDKEEYHSLADIVYKEVRRMNETIENFLRFSRPEPIQKENFQLSELIRSIDTQYKTLLNEKSIDILIELNWDGLVNWDKDKIKQVLINLIQNSIDAISQKGLIKIIIKADNNIAKIELSDNGIGIPKNNLKNIFNLYFTTKASGTGIGLGIIQRIIHEHDGIINVKSEEDIGTRFIIRLPIK
ncbi:MAG: ATP-binding protein [Bacteroidota bacterium]